MYNNSAYKLFSKNIVILQTLKYKNTFFLLTKYTFKDFQLAFSRIKDDTDRDNISRLSIKKKLTRYKLTHLKLGEHTSHVKIKKKNIYTNFTEHKSSIKIK